MAGQVSCFASRVRPVLTYSCPLVQCAQDADEEEDELAGDDGRQDGLGRLRRIANDQIRSMRQELPTILALEATEAANAQVDFLIHVIKVGEASCALLGKVHARHATSRRKKLEEAMEGAECVACGRELSNENHVGTGSVSGTCTSDLVSCADEIYCAAVV